MNSHTNNVNVCTISKYEFQKLTSEDHISSNFPLRDNPQKFKKFSTSRKLFLESVYKLLSPISRNKIKLVEKLTKIDEYILDSSSTISRRNSSGVYLTISSSLGVGFSPFFINNIKNTLLKGLLKKIPQFYFLGGLGLALLKTCENGKNRLQVIALRQHETLKDVQSFVAEISVIALNYGYGFDTEQSEKKDTYTAQNLGILGTIRQADEHFSYNLIAGASFPPVAPAFMVYTTKGRFLRFKLFEIPLPKMLG